MKNIILTITLAFLGLSAMAQTGIGTPNPNASAQLHIEASDKGVLIPQVALTDLADATSIAEGNVNSLLVYNTTTDAATAMTPGYYYWQDTAWQRLMPKGDIYANVKYDGTNFTYINAAGDEVIIDLEDLIQNLETNTFIRKEAGVVDAVDPTNNTPTVYYYFSEEAIKDWLAADVANVDPSTMLNTDPGVVAITVTDDVVANFEYILNQEITYEGEQITIEEIIKNISSEVEGNVIYEDNGSGEMVFKYFDGTNYVTIDLGNLVQELETNTFIRKEAGVVDAVDPTNNTPTVYYYFSEEAIKDWLAADVANVDPSTMPNTDPGVIAITVSDDVVANFEYILNQEITYEGEQITIEEIIKNISSEVEGNVIYVNDKDENDPSAVDNWVFKYYDGTNYVTIDLGDFVRENQLTYEVIGADPYVTVTEEIDPDTPNLTTYYVDVKAAMPKFFYMPTILFDTSNLGSHTKNLHEEYLNQFTGQNASTFAKNPDAPDVIPNIPTATDLHYYITSFDEDVVENVMITDAGIMTYDVINNAGPYSYITVIFVVK